jgi:hypothetical protein
MGGIVSEGQRRIHREPIGHGTLHRGAKRRRRGRVDDGFDGVDSSARTVMVISSRRRAPPASTGTIGPSKLL